MMTVIWEKSMPIHSCGNPLHDVPQWVLMAVPFLASAAVWIRGSWAVFRARLS